MRTWLASLFPQQSAGPDWPGLAWTGTDWERRQHECRQASQATPSITKAETYKLQRLVRTCVPQTPEHGKGGGEHREGLDKHLSALLACVEHKSSAISLYEDGEF